VIESCYRIKCDECGIAVVHSVKSEKTMRRRMRWKFVRLDGKDVCVGCNLALKYPNRMSNKDRWLRSAQP
jgi:hypothetical protein